MIPKPFPPFDIAPHGNVPSLYPQADLAICRRHSRYSRTVDMLGTPIELALRYAAAGYYVLPCHYIRQERTGPMCSCLNLKGNCHAGKHPYARLVPHGLKDATTRPDIIRQWWQDHPRANIGIRTGSLSRTVVIDIDPAHGGNLRLQELEDEYGQIYGTTLQVESGSGGLHFYFSYERADIRPGIGFLGPGIDVRGEDSIIIAPPSSHISGGTYTWTRLVKPRALPKELAAFLRSKSARRQAPPSLPDVIGAGVRRAALLSYAGKMRAFGFTSQETFAALWQMNVDRCRPSCPSAHVEAIVDDVFRGLPKRRNVPAILEARAKRRRHLHEDALAYTASQTIC